MHSHKNFPPSAWIVTCHVVKVIYGRCLHFNNLTGFLFNLQYVAILDVNEQLGIKLENELNEKFAMSRAKFIKCDVSDEKQLKNAYKKVFDDAGYIDVVINNAGVINETAENFKRCIDINVVGIIILLL